MITFLTSSPTGALDGSYVVDGLDSSNSFTDNLKKYWKKNARVLMITAFPSAHEASDQMTEFFRDVTVKAGLSVSCFDLWDDRTCDTSGETLNSYDVIILGGGHVPTQNDFFQKLSLKEKIRGFDGIVIGISAGSMNAADIVYAQPEEDGEAADPSYQRWIPGLALTDINVLPHYNMVHDYYKDGMHLFRDITCPDSDGHKFLALADGSYLMITPEETKVYGNAWKIYPDRIEQICHTGESKKL
ncbi:MAG: Type 1 glutamine amidotransferase-like domain-containing protein [Lachnospiraceae bacterium]|nr:Type 1 glutamine amidotransferase-like domain-containing protein [Lachnospiraceae bacterium]MDY4968656.1 Type 1 glutamine amidotransferase-like domain-containing protein [Lachnospiraceae bacterium]